MTHLHRRQDTCNNTLGADHLIPVKKKDCSANFGK